MREYGAVKMYKGGWGFITPEWGSGFEVFLHIDDLKKAGIETVKRGQRLSFVIIKDKRGRDRASSIKVAE
jgi:CspA family cold shock protein